MTGSAIATAMSLWRLFNFPSFTLLALVVVMTHDMPRVLLLLKEVAGVLMARVLDTDDEDEDEDIDVDAGVGTTTMEDEACDGVPTVGTPGNKDLGTGG
jgi:hypothetical protein